MAGVTPGLTGAALAAAGNTVTGAFAYVPARCRAGRDAA